MEGKDPDTPLDRALIQDYEETVYRVRDGAIDFVLELGRPCEPLAQLYRERRKATAAFISGFNPYSQATDPVLNEEANARLRADLESGGCEVLEARGSNREGTWEEASFLALGLARDVAMALGRRYRQNAIVFAEADAVPELLLLR